MLKNMQVHKLILFSFVFLLVLSAGVFAEAKLDVDVSLPEGSVLQGETVTLSISMENKGTIGATGVSYEIITGTEITGYSTGLISVDSVPAGSIRRHNVPITISSTASDGTYAVTVKIRYGGGTDSPIIKSKTLRVGPQESFHVSEINYEENMLEPGKTRDIEIVLKNVGDGTVRHIFGKLVPNSSDIVPSGAGGESFINYISSDDYGVLNFKVTIDNKAESKTYPANLILNYESVSGKRFTESISLGLPVSGTPKLEVLNYEIRTNRFEVRIENLGTARARAIRVALIQGGEIISVDVDNELRIDRYSTFRFDTFKKGLGTLRITYLDENNVELEKEIPVQIDASSGGLGISSGAVFLILVLIVMGAYILKLKEIGPFKKNKK